jgi:hypothetical protein
LEGILTYDFGIDCVRFDGDVDPKVRNAELERFKTSPTCRVLLATVQSGGTGLNIVEASHVCFLDRWFNPTVHAQAQDRCHRIGQTKPVYVFFADVAMTVDQVMGYLNLIKSMNAFIILADGTELAATPEGVLSYKELAGLFGNLIRAVKLLRQARAKEYYNLPLPPVGHDVLAEAAAKKATRSKPAVKSEPAEPSAAAEPVPAKASSSEELEIEPPQPQHHYETIGKTNVLALSDSDDDDSLFDDMQPTFKSR